MNNTVITLGVLIIFLALIVMSGSALAWMAAVSGSEPTPAQDTLITLADWTVKAAVGALLGFAGGAGLARRSGSGAVAG